MRSILTILGIVIGIAAIILVQAVGSGARDLILNQIRGLGSKTIVVEPGREPKGPSDFTSIFLDSLKEKDYKSLIEQSASLGVTNIMPIVFAPVPMTVGGETKTVNVIGTTDSIERVLGLYPDEGSFFGEDENLSRASVVLIGSEVKKDLFGDGDALGQKIRIKNRNYLVVGAFSSKGQVGFFNMDEAAIVPHTTAMEYITGKNYYNEFILEAEDEKNVEQTKQNIVAALRDMHGIDDPEKDDFHVMSQEDIVKRVDMITGILSALLVSVAAVSLIVGGVGIMNIMLVSVTERTREIGLRKALGATEKNILSQFIFEAVLLTATGGAIGVSLGAFLAFVTSLILSKVVSQNWVFSFPIDAALTGLAVSSLVGLVFGFYPARQAAKKNPIEALRYE